MKINDDIVKQFVQLESELRDTGLIYRKHVQALVRLANSCKSARIYKSAINRLQWELDEYEVESLRKPDAFRPCGPESLLSQGNLHFFDQIDNIFFMIIVDILLTGLLILGGQKSGKSRFIEHLCQELVRVKPHIRITIIDPKGAFRHLAPVLNAEYIDLANISIDLTQPDIITLDRFVYELIPVLAESCNLIYGQELVNRGAELALEQRKAYIEKAGRETNLSLQDIHHALQLVKTNNFRITGYLDAAKTALSLILGKQNLFSCRKGLPLDWVFSRNTIINARCLTAPLQCRFFVTYLLYWLYQSSRDTPETNEVKHVLIIDDSSRFIGTSLDGRDRASQLGHLLAVLRSTGNCLIAASQLPAQTDPAVISLSRNMIVIGNITGRENLNVVENFMALSKEQTQAITRFAPRECLAFISGNPWPYPIHGWTPYVPDRPETAIDHTDLPRTMEPWHALTDIPEKQSQSIHVATKINKTAKTSPAKSELPNFKGEAEKLVWDCINYLFDKVRARVARLKFSIRMYERAKSQATQNGYLMESSSGKSKYLIPTQKAYDRFNQPCPYKRNVSIEHSFYVLLTSHCLKQDSQLSKIQPETPIGTQGAAIDVTTTDKSGHMHAYAIVLSTSNLLSAALRFQDSSYDRIIWLCRSVAAATAVRSYFNRSATLPADLLARFEYSSFSKLSSLITKG